MKVLYTERHLEVERTEKCCVLKKISQKMKPFLCKVGMLLHTFSLATTILFTALFLTNCSKLRDNFDIGGVPNLKPPIATDYSLESSGCTWNFANFTEDSLYIIEDSLELLHFISCTGSNSPPEIDFSKYSLLFVHGNASRGIFSIDKNYERFAMLDYKLNIKILLNDTAVPKHWHTAMLVPKLPQNAAVVLNVSMNCVDTIPFTNYPLGSAWFNLQIGDPSVGFPTYIINSDTDLIAIVGNISIPIDFINHTLVCLRGVYGYRITKMDTTLLKNYCADQYILNIEIEGYAAMPQAWHISILTPKIYNTTDITLNVKYN